MENVPPESDGPREGGNPTQCIHLCWEGCRVIAKYGPICNSARKLWVETLVDKYSTSFLYCDYYCQSEYAYFRTLPSK